MSLSDLKKKLCSSENLVSSSPIEYLLIVDGNENNIEKFIQLLAEGRTYYLPEKKRTEHHVSMNVVRELKDNIHIYSCNSVYNVQIMNKLCDYCAEKSNVTVILTYLAFGKL